jgi:PAS domain S-box-containing protein
MNDLRISGGPPVEQPTRSHKHIVQLYADDRHLVSVLSTYIGRALTAGGRTIVVATFAHRSELSVQLLNQGFDLENLARQGLYIIVDAAELLARFTVKGLIDERLFYSSIAAIFDRPLLWSGDVSPNTTIFGEMVALLWAAGKPEEAIRLERCWNKPANIRSFSLLCAYPIMGFFSETDVELFVRACGEHGCVSLSDKDYCDCNLELTFKPQPLDHEFPTDLMLKERELRFWLLTEAARERSVFMTDMEGRISTWNIGAELMHGYAAGEVVGRHVSFLDGEEDSPHDKLKLKCTTAIQKGWFEEECWRTRKDGSRFLATLAITPARNASGDLIGFAETVHYSTKTSRLNEPEIFGKRACRTTMLRRSRFFPR